MRGSMSAKEAGSRFAWREIRDGHYENLEDVIFTAMASSPYKSAQARKDFVEGASEWVNTKGRLENYAMNLPR